MSARTLSLTLTRGNTTRLVTVPVHSAVIAGWTGRDRAAVEQHIEELAALGVARPQSIPTFYPISATRPTTAPTIDVLGEATSGEVEFVLLQHEGRLWLSVGSDHTDRTVESFSVAVSKQMCDKPVATDWWALDEAIPHWGELILRSYIGPERTLYQQGSVTSMLDPTELIARFTDSATLPPQSLLFCGTLPAIGGVRPSGHFAFELQDPVLDRRIGHEYRVNCLPFSG